MRQPWKRTGKKSFGVASSKIKRAVSKRANYCGSKADWRITTAAVAKRDGHKCKRCKRYRSELKPGETMQTHHLKRVARGGTDHKYNLVLVCSTCHENEPGHAHMKRKRKKAR